MCALSFESSICCIRICDLTRGGGGGLGRVRFWVLYLTIANVLLLVVERRRSIPEEFWVGRALCSINNWRA